MIILSILSNEIGINKKYEYSFITLETQAVVKTLNDEWKTRKTYNCLEYSPMSFIDVSKNSWIWWAFKMYYNNGSYAFCYINKNKTKKAA